MLLLQWRCACGGFCFLLHVAVQEEKQRYKLADPGEHRYINSNDAALEMAKGRAFHEMYVELREGLKIVGFEANEIETLFTILSAILHTGDVVCLPKNLMKNFNCSYRLPTL
jgi:myosin heavy subunit